MYVTVSLSVTERFCVLDNFNVKIENWRSTTGKCLKCETYPLLVGRMISGQRLLTRGVDELRAALLLVQEDGLVVDDSAGGDVDGVGCRGERGCCQGRGYRACRQGWQCRGVFFEHSFQVQYCASVIGVDQAIVHESAFLTLY